MWVPVDVDAGQGEIVFPHAHVDVLVESALLVQVHYLEHCAPQRAEMGQYIREGGIQRGRN